MKPRFKLSSKRIVCSCIILLIVCVGVVVYREAGFMDELKYQNAEVSQEVKVGGAYDDSIPYFRSEFGVNVAGQVLHVWYSADLLHSTRHYLIRLDPDSYADIVAAALRKPDHVDPSPKALDLGPEAPEALKAWWVPPKKNVVNGHSSPPYTEYFDMEYDPVKQLLYFETEI